MRTDVELRLREAGLLILPRNTRADNPLLAVGVTVTHGGGAAMVTLHLIQLLTFKTGDPTFVTTWDSEYVMANQTAQRVRGTVKDAVDEFLNAWLASKQRSSLLP